MTELLVVIVTALVVIAAATEVGLRLGIAAPLVLVPVGVAASFLPVFSSAHIEPAWILEGVLPPLLYSAAVSMPAMNFRREFGAIGGLSVLLVVGSALLLGLFFMLVVPGLGFAWGVALGAIVSPTDAVATSIIKQASVSKRVVAILDGESLLNDATALVMLRSAIVAAAAAFSLWDAVGLFAYSVVVALVIGVAAAWLNLVVRRRVTDPTVNTVISFAVPFAASVPAGLIGASGLVAAVVAGLITGVRAPRDLSPQTGRGGRADRRGTDPDHRVDADQRRDRPRAAAPRGLPHPGGVLHGEEPPDRGHRGAAVGAARRPRQRRLRRGRPDRCAGESRRVADRHRCAAGPSDDRPAAAGPGQRASKRALSKSA